MVASGKAVNRSDGSSEDSPAQIARFHGIAKGRTNSKVLRSERLNSYFTFT